jgi:hypothetical protein
LRCLDALRTECRARGRAIEALTLSLRAGLSLRPDPLGPDRRPLRGSAEQVVDDVRRCVALGIDTVLLETRYRDLDDLTGIFETFAERVRDRV